MSQGNGVTKYTLPFIAMLAVGVLGIVGPFIFRRHNMRFKAPITNISTIPQDSVIKVFMVYGDRIKVYRGTDGHDYYDGFHEKIHYIDCELCAKRKK